MTNHEISRCGHTHPGSLYKREGTGHAYWYRVYYPMPGKQAEEWVGIADNT
jgi:hypothetical protein